MKRVLFVVALVLAACQEPSDEVIHDPGQLHAGDTLRWMSSAPDLFDGEWKYNGQPDDAFRARMASIGVRVVAAPVKQSLVRAAAMGTADDIICIDETLYVHHGVDNWEKRQIYNYPGNNSTLGQLMNFTAMASDGQWVANGVWVSGAHAHPYWDEFPTTTGGTVSFSSAQICTPLGCRTQTESFPEGKGGHYKRCWYRGVGGIVRNRYFMKCGALYGGMMAGDPYYLDDAPRGVVQTRTLNMGGVFLDTPSWQIIGTACQLGAGAFSPKYYGFCKAGGYMPEQCYLWPPGSMCNASDTCPP